MSFSVEALQSRSRQESHNRAARDHERKSNRYGEPIAGTMTGGAANKGIAGIVSHVVGKIWPKTHRRQPPNSNSALPDNSLDVDHAVIVYDQPIEDGFIEVPLASQVQITPRQQLSIVKDIRAKPSDCTSER